MIPGLTCFEVFTLFPAAIEGFVGAGLLGRAIEQGLVTVRCTDFRDFTPDRHRTVDDAPFGGGAGMVIKPGPVVDAMEHVARERGPFHRVLLTPSAPRFDQRAAARLARLPRIGLLCGRYEGIDDRVREHYVDECLSLGDFVLGGGEVAALVIIEAVSRLVEGVVGNPESVHTDSFGRTGDTALLEHPQYTRPAEFRGHAVPPVLLGGDHAAIARWRHAGALRRTWALRPDLRARPRLAPMHPLYLAVPAAAVPEAAELATVARHHGVTGLVVMADRELDDPLAAWLQATAGRTSVAVLSDAKALRRRLQRGAIGEPRFVRVVAAGSPLDPGQDPPCERPEALLDLLATAPAGAAASPAASGPTALGPVVLWVDPRPPPSGMPIHAIYAPQPSSAPWEGTSAAPSAPGPGPNPHSEPSADPHSEPSPEPSPKIAQGHDLTSPPGPQIAQGLAIEHAIADISRPFPRVAALAHAALTGLRDRG